MQIYKKLVTKEECDVYDHMNTMHYMKMFYDAADNYFLKLGWTDPILSKMGIGCAYLEFNTRFIKEVFAGTDIFIDLKEKSRSSKVITVEMEMKKEAGELVSVAELKFLFFDLSSRKSIPLNNLHQIDINM